MPCDTVPVPGGFAIVCGRGGKRQTDEEAILADLRAQAKVVA